MNRSWVRFPQAAQIRPPGSGWAFLYTLTGRAARCARGRRPARSPFVPACCCLWPRWCSGRRRARPPARLGDLTSFGAAPRSPPVPSGPSGTLHTSGAWCADGDPRHLESPARPLYSPWASQEPRVLIFWDTPKRIVTNVVNPRAFSLKTLVFGLRLTTFVTEVLARRLKSRWFDDVSNASQP